MGRTHCLSRPSAHTGEIQIEGPHAARAFVLAISPPGGCTHETVVFGSVSPKRVRLHSAKSSLSSPSVSGGGARRGLFAFVVFFGIQSPHHSLAQEANGKSCQGAPHKG